MNIKRTNINNLISLWKTVGSSFQQYFQNRAFSYCLIPNSEWPNRVWFNESVTTATLEAVTELVRKSYIPLSVSYWGDFGSSQNPLFEQFGFSKKSEQLGMSLKLQQKLKELNRLDIKKVIEPNQVNIWAEIYPQNFGYKISTETLDKTKDQIQYYLVYWNQKPIGTAITYETEGTIGIHGMGIVPEFRKQGFAEEVMAHLLNEAIENNKKFAVLQSSAMGKNIYKKLRFTEDFLMTNYILK